MKHIGAHFRLCMDGRAITVTGRVAQVSTEPSPVRAASVPCATNEPAVSERRCNHRHRENAANAPPDVRMCCTLLRWRRYPRHRQLCSRSQCVHCQEVQQSPDGHLDAQHMSQLLLDVAATTATGRVALWLLPITRRQCNMLRCAARSPADAANAVHA